MAGKYPLPQEIAHEGSFNKVSLRQAKVSGLDVAKQLRYTPHGFAAHWHKCISLPGENGTDLPLGWHQFSTQVATEHAYMPPC